MAEEKYVDVAACDEHRQNICSKLDDALRALNTLNDRLYKDNGHRSIQSKLNDHERILRVVIWVACIVGVATIGNIVLIGREIIMKLIGLE